MITGRRKFYTKITVYEILVSISIVVINSRPFSGLYTPYKKPPQIFCDRCSTRVDNTANNADITQSLAANHHRLLSLVTLGLVEPRRMQ